MTWSQMAEVDILPNHHTPIQQFYKDSVILITGATGFIGKLLIEKLLRTCPDVKKLILLVRTKKNKTPQQRIEELLQKEIYEKLERFNPKFRKTIEICAGDCSKEGLGLSTEDRNKIISEVNVVFHLAATVRFDEKLKIATEINLQGTKELLNLCKECTKLQVLLHCSTAYSCCTHTKIEEKFYKPVRDPEEFINYVNHTNEDELNSRCAEIIGEYPNTYTFTKSLAEEIVRKYMKSVPIVLYRPSIVIGTYKDPIPGWTDTIIGPTGLVIGTAAGILRTAEVELDIKCDLVPADMVVNSILATAWQRAQSNGEKQPEVFNFVTSSRNPITWREYMFWTLYFGTAYPLSKALWYYTLFPTKFHLLYLIYNFFLHTIPAYILDTTLMIQGKRPILRKIYKKVDKLSSLITYFAKNQWEWDDNNIQLLWNKIDKRDKELFQFNVENLYWDEFLFFYVRTVRHYLLNDPLPTSASARKRYAKLKLAHYGLVSSLLGLFAYFMYVFVFKQFL